jgi:2,4-dienoyl-CoA reductase-like NADH-dependent reductase (Old Yellow Enzyme family)
MAYSVPTSREALERLCAEAGVSLPYSDDVSVLKTPVTIKGKTIANRIAYQAMEGCDGTPGGLPDELTRRRYLRFARGGAAIIWFEATAVLPEGRANPRQLYMDEHNYMDFAPFVEEIKETCLKENGYEPLVIVQLTHSGRYSKPEGVPAPLIAYNNPIFEGDKPIDASRIVTDDYLDLVCEKLANAAGPAEKAGFDGCDVKCCHRYLNSELLSAFERKGRYGGPWENRTRLMREAFCGAVANTSDRFIVSSRLNIYDGFPYPYGFSVLPGRGIEPDFTEAKRLVRDLANHGAALLNFTMGNPYFNPHVNRPFASGTYDPPEHPMAGVARMLTGIAEVAAAVPGMRVISSWLSYLGSVSPHVAASAVDQRWFDFAGYGRETLAYPDCARDICREGGLDPKKVCLACGKCTEIMRTPGGTPGCPVRDRETYLPIYRRQVMGK